MKAYEKINHAITFLLPDSATKVFNFVNDLFNQDLDPEFFKQKFWNYSAAEQYFICYYLGVYFDSSDRYTFYNKWLLEQEKIYSDSDEYEAFIDKKGKLHKNKSRLSNVLLGFTPTAERRMKQLKKLKVSYVDYENYFNRELLDYRIPLHRENIASFKAKFINIMKEVMDKNQAQQFFYNSFSHENNSRLVRLLYIEVANLGLLYEQMFNVKEEYESFKYNIENHVEKYNQKIAKLPEKKEEFYRILSSPKATGFRFATIMYNAFPEIRDKQKDKDLTTYLKNRASNIVIR